VPIAVFNFSHIVRELSFGERYPKLHNPLDHVIASTPHNFYKFQYYLSLVPTVYTEDGTVESPDAVFTNQYSVTDQSIQVTDHNVPGIFFKYDIEPILLTISAQRMGFLAFMIRLINVISGVLVAGEWCYRLFDVIYAAVTKRKGAIGGGMLFGDEKHV